LVFVTLFIVGWDATLFIYCVGCHSFFICYDATLFICCLGCHSFYLLRDAQDVTLIIYCLDATLFVKCYSFFIYCSIDVELIWLDGWLELLARIIGWNHWLELLLT
jgi:hypothetical protein